MNGNTWFSRALNFGFPEGVLALQAIHIKVYRKQHNYFPLFYFFCFLSFQSLMDICQSEIALVEMVRDGWLYCWMVGRTPVTVCYVARFLWLLFKIYSSLDYWRLIGKTSQHMVSWDEHIFRVFVCLVIYFLYILHIRNVGRSKLIY